MHGLRVIFPVVSIPLNHPLFIRIQIHVKFSRFSSAISDRVNSRTTQDHSYFHRSYFFFFLSLVRSLFLQTVNRYRLCRLNCTHTPIVARLTTSYFLRARIVFISSQRSSLLIRCLRWFCQYNCSSHNSSVR